MTVSVPGAKAPNVTLDPFNDFATRVRTNALRMAFQAKASHIGGAFSMADILAVLYGEGGYLRVDPRRPDAPERDRFILSKGHACIGLYAALALSGFIPLAELETYGKPGTRLMSHASHKVPGVELSTGSLGHGLPVACGLALGAKRLGRVYQTVVLLSDGEMDEGSNWEGLLFGAHHGLDNLTVIIDANGSQGFGETNQVMNLEPLATKLTAFGWETHEVDGHNYSALTAALGANGSGRPKALVARTVKGKGVSFMENQLAWHYKSPTEAQFIQALAELEGRQVNA
jgi:transketolase